MGAYERISAPGKIGKLSIKNRISLSPMEKNWGDRHGNPSQAFIDYLVERAKGGVGMMNIEATYVDARGRGNLFQLGLWDDSNIAWHKRLNDAVHEFGTRTSAELNHGGRNSATARTGLQPVAPTSIPNEIVGSWIPKELNVAEIAEIIEKFAQGARRAIAAGYDMITIHGAHGYLITSFLSPKHNLRTDEYGGGVIPGGNAEGRWRFPREVYKAIRREVGPNVPIGFRISASENIDGGLTEEQSANFIRYMETLDLDFVDVSTGIYENIETLIQPMDFRQGCLLPLARAMRQKVKIPVIAAGRINQIQIAEQALANGDADFVHMGRAFHADPEILAKTLRGNEEDIVGCIACNKCCAVLFVNQRSVCTVNPAAGRERAMKLVKADKPRRVMVVGGGLAGMEAAAVAAQRGHSVTLYEKTDALGGIIKVLSMSKNRHGWKRAADDRIRMLSKSGAKSVKGKEITLEDIEREMPNVLILATGTKPFIPRWIPGITEDIVTNYDEIVQGGVDVGVNVVVFGGQGIALATAEYLAEKGADVTVINPSGELAADVEYMAQKVLLARIEANRQISVRLNTSLEAIGKNSVTVQSKGDAEEIRDVDQVVFAWERDMERTLFEELSGGWAESLGIELHVIGDAAWPREPYDAVLEGAIIGRTI